jgi:hypothetical protein
MNSDLFEIILPSFAFFVGFFLLYTILEMLVTLSLNLIIFRYWGFATEVTDPPRIKRNRRIELAICLFIALSVVTIVCYSRVIDVLLASEIEVRVFALEVFLAMLFIYMVTTHELLEDHFIKKAHKYLYFYISSIVFVLAILFSNRYYADYQDYIHATLFFKSDQSQSLILSREERDRNLMVFREMIYNGLCPEADFSSYYRSGRVMNFVYVVTHPDLKIAQKPLLTTNVKAHLSGRLCSSGNTSFLLTDYGQWYWVIQGERIAKN